MKMLGPNLSKNQKYLLRVKGLSTNSFVMLNRFCHFSKTSTSTSQFLTDNIKISRITTKIKWKMQPLFTLYFKFWRYFLLKFVRWATISFISCFILAFTSADIIFHKYLELHSTSEKKIFVTIFSLKRIHSNPPPP